MSTKAKEIIFMIVWFAVLITVIQFFRFKFGLFRISIVWILVGIPLFWLFKRLTKNTDSNQ